MARKLRLQGKWKQIGCSIVSVGILSCGAGYRTRHVGYLPFTGPVDIRIEQPKQRSEVFILEPLNTPEPEESKEITKVDSENVETNSVPPIKETHLSASSRPVQLPPHLNQPVVEPVPEQPATDELSREFFPDGFADDLFGDPLLNDKVSLRMFLDFFQTNQTQEIRRIPFAAEPDSGSSSDSDTKESPPDKPNSNLP